MLRSYSLIFSREANLRFRALGYNGRKASVKLMTSSKNGELEGSQINFPSQSLIVASIEAQALSNKNQPKEDENIGCPIQKYSNINETSFDSAQKIIQVFTYDN